MDFSEYLQSRKVNKHFRSSRELFDFYGGNKNLKISLRQFRNIESGVIPPTIELLGRMFSCEAFELRHELLQAYFNSHLGQKPEFSELISYIGGHLSQSLVAGKFDWESLKYTFYNDGQLDLLVKNAAAFKLWRRILLLDKVPASDPGIDKKALEALIDEELVKRDGRYLKPRSSLFRIPAYGKAPPRTIAKTYDFIRNHLDNYLSREGSERQELKFSMQLMTPEMAKTAREQAAAYIRWFQSHVVLNADTYKGPLVPVVGVIFCKELFDAELL